MKKLLNMLPWREGRQDGGYKKLPILARFRFDSYLLYFPEGSVVKPHKDRVQSGFRHFRLNVTLRRPKAGGKFVCDKVLLRLPRAVVFRPDVQEHSLTAVENGYLLLFSVGWLKKALRTADAEG